MPVRQLLKETENRMHKSVELVRSEFNSIRTGKANPALVENILVDYYNTPTKIRDLASISTPDPKLITIQPWDPTVIGEIEKAIMKTELGITPSSDGKVLRLPIPELSEERRMDLIKYIKKMAEEGKVSVRNIRRDAIEAIRKMEKDKKITEDDKFENEKVVQKKTEAQIKLIDEIVVHKEKEWLVQTLLDRGPVGIHVTINEKKITRRGTLPQIVPPERHE